MKICILWILLLEQRYLYPSPPPLAASDRPSPFYRTLSDPFSLHHERQHQRKAHWGPFWAWALLRVPEELGRPLGLPQERGKGPRAWDEAAVASDHLGSLSAKAAK